jgi:formyl-CoA transferase
VSGPTSIVPELQAIFATKDRTEWFELLRKADCQVAPVYSMDEALHDPHHRARGTISDIDDPSVGRVTQIGPLVKLNATAARIRHLGRTPGADTRDVLAEFGVAAEQIDALTASAD